MTTLVLTLALALPGLAFAVWPPLAARRSPTSTVDGRRARGPRDGEGHRAAGDPGARAGSGGGPRRRRGLSRPADPLRGERRGRPSPARRAGARGRCPSCRRPRRNPIPWTRQPVALGAMGAGLLVFGLVLGLLVSRFSTPAPPEPGMAAPRRGVAPAAPGAAGGGPPRPIPKEMLEGMLKAAHAEPRRRPLPGGDRRLHGRPPARAPERGRHHPPGGDPGAGGPPGRGPRGLRSGAGHRSRLRPRAVGQGRACRRHARTTRARSRRSSASSASRRPGADRDRAQERIRQAKTRLAAAPKAARRRPGQSRAAIAEPRGRAAIDA